jgi:hypothetical protein
MTITGVVIQNYKGVGWGVDTNQQEKLKTRNVPFKKDMLFSLKYRVQREEGGGRIEHSVN